MSNFKNLQINKDLILIRLREFSDDSNVIVERKGQADHYRFNKNSTVVRLIVHLKNNGTITLQPSGSEIDLSTLAAEYVVNNCKSPKASQFNLSLKGFPVDEFDGVLGYLVEDCGASVLDDVMQQGDRVCRIQGKQNDKLTLTLYHTGTFLVQGVPVVLAIELLLYLSECSIVSEDKLFGFMNDVFETTLTPAAAREQCEAQFKEAFEFSGEDLKKLISTAVSMQGMPITVEDYSVIAFPALKALELFMKSAVYRACSQRWLDFADVFDRVSRAPLIYKVKPSMRNEIGCEKTCLVLEGCYPFYSAQRHGMFHADGLDGATRIIEGRLDAVEVSQAALNLIDHYCQMLKV